MLEDERFHAAGPCVDPWEGETDEGTGEEAVQRGSVVGGAWLKVVVFEFVGKREDAAAVWWLWRRQGRDALGTVGGWVGGGSGVAVEGWGGVGMVWGC